MPLKRVLLRGDILRPDGITEGCIMVEDGRIAFLDEGPCREAPGGSRVVTGLIIPGFIDMHTHLADQGARGDLPPSLEGAVMPGGLKHRFLDTAGNGGIIASIRASLKELRPGVTQVLDYREGGLKGLQMLSKAAGKWAPRVHALARPAPGDDIDLLLERAAGLGLPSLSETGHELIELARGRGKVLSLHASELYREDVDRVLSLRPDLVIHMVSGTLDDWHALAMESVPVAVCPRSNAAYGLTVPLHEMDGCGLRIGLGTDNSMSARQDMFREMEWAWTLLRKGGLTGSEVARKVFSMAVGEALEGCSLLKKLPRWTGWWEKGWPRKGDPAHLAVVRSDRAVRDRDPYSFLVRFRSGSQVIWTGP